MLKPTEAEQYFFKVNRTGSEPEFDSAIAKDYDHAIRIMHNSYPHILSLEFQGKKSIVLYDIHRYAFDRQTLDLFDRASGSEFDD